MRGQEGGKGGSAVRWIAKFSVALCRVNGTLAHVDDGESTMARWRKMWRFILARAEFGEGEGKGEEARRK